MAFHAALTYDGRIAIEPADPLDGMIRHLFNGHQHRGKGTGVALGPRAAPMLARVAAASGAIVMGDRTIFVLAVERCAADRSSGHGVDDRRSPNCCPSKPETSMRGACAGGGRWTRGGSGSSLATSIFWRSGPASAETRAAMDGLTRSPPAASLARKRSSHAATLRRGFGCRFRAAPRARLASRTPPSHRPRPHRQARTAHVARVSPLIARSARVIADAVEEHVVAERVRRHRHAERLLQTGDGRPLKGAAAGANQQGRHRRRADDLPPPRGGTWKSSCRRPRSARCTILSRAGRAKPVRRQDRLLGFYRHHDRAVRPVRRRCRQM